MLDGLAFWETKRARFSGTRPNPAQRLDLAKIADVTQPTINRFLNGAEIRNSSIDKLAAHFGLKLCREKKGKG